MGTFFRTAFHFKNIPLLERMLRVGAGMGMAVAAWAVTMPLWAAGVTLANALFVAATGFVGFCPACYLAGRQLAPRERGR